MRIALISLCLLWGAMARAAGPDLLDLLKSADVARSGHDEGMTWQVDLSSDEEDQKTESQFLVKTLGNKAYVEALSPARSKGEIMLFLGRMLWFYKPGLSRPISLSTRQRLSGQAANGDIASTNYAEDYEAKFLAEESIEGVVSYKLLLSAKSKETTYDKINYWISKDRKQGIKAEFLALDGTPLKVASFKYGNKIKIKAQTIDFVTEMRIVDARNAKNWSQMLFHQPKVDKHSESLFQVNNLKR